MCCEMIETNTISIDIGKRLKSKGEENSHFLLDAGTSTFDSSLAWFTCGYSQVCLDQYSLDWFLKSLFYYITCVGLGSCLSF